MKNYILQGVGYIVKNAEKVNDVEKRNKRDNTNRINDAREKDKIDRNNGSTLKREKQFIKFAKS